MVWYNSHMPPVILQLTLVLPTPVIDSVSLPDSDEPTTAPMLAIMKMN